jgi:hypothetical protein
MEDSPRRPCERSVAIQRNLSKIHNLKNDQVYLEKDTNFLYGLWNELNP